jgi:hypothetical protein
MFGVMIGALGFAVVMINLWAWDIVSIDRMVEFNRDPVNVYTVTAIALGAMIASGYLCAALFDRRKK